MFIMDDIVWEGYLVFREVVIEVIFLFLDEEKKLGCEMFEFLINS